MKKCKKFLNEGLIENLKSKNGEILVLYKNKNDGQLARKIIVTQEDFDELLVLIGKEKNGKLDVSKLDTSSLEVEDKEEPGLS